MMATIFELETFQAFLFFCALKSGVQARSSVGERYLDRVDVGGSIPPAPTISYHLAV
jgi:hypothetical protein